MSMNEIKTLIEEKKMSNIMILKENFQKTAKELLNYL